jgi:hypothetical protein
MRPIWMLVLGVVRRVSGLCLNTCILGILTIDEGKGYELKL